MLGESVVPLYRAAGPPGPEGKVAPLSEGRRPSPEAAPFENSRSSNSNRWGHSPPSASAQARRFGSSPVDRRSYPTLQRVLFRTSRLAEFCSVNELTKQVGHPPPQWPLVCLKELTDNALDAAEEARIAPHIDIDVSTDAGEIVITDNGPGLSAETITGVLDYNVRASSREAYVSPSRGKQGYALKTIIAMAQALDGSRGETVIESRGQAYRIVFQTDRVRREPRIHPPEIVPSDVQTGTRITVRWPRTACDLLEAAESRFVQIAGDFSAFNPHLTLRCRWDGEEVVDVCATDPDWRKWRTCDPTSAHWYRTADFESYIAAHVARDQDQGHTGRTVRDFISELRGLRRPGAQKLVLAETGVSHTALAAFFVQGPDTVARLLGSCKGHTAPVKPEALGLLGADHLMADCAKLGGAEASFRYKKHLGITQDGLPYVIEAAFAYRPQASARRVIAGINFSIAINNPFNQLGHFDDLSSALARQHIEFDDPVIVVLHYTSPRVDFSDHGKSILTLPTEAGRIAADLIAAVAKDWARQRREELRRNSAEANRRIKLLKQLRRPDKPEPPQPSGALAEKISEAALGAGMSVNDLVVLSPENDPYTSWRRRRQAEWFAALFDRRVPPGATKHLRGFFYLLVTTTPTGPNGKTFVNDYQNWQLLQKAAKAARWLGLVPFDRIIDERNTQPEIYVPSVSPISTGVHAGAGCTIPIDAKDALPRLFIDGFRGRQTHRIIFFGEKSSLAIVLRPIAEAIGADMVLVTGETSDRRLYEAIDRANADGRPAVLLYFADFDPSGHQMSISVARKVQALRDFEYTGLNIQLYRVALTIEQVRDLWLPSAPFKRTEKRARQWREAFGHEQTEIDAMVELHPEALRQAVFDAVAPYYDDTLDDRVRQAEEAWRKKADDALRAHPDYGDCRERIEAAFEYVQKAAAELQYEQDRATEILRVTLPSPPERPRAAPTATAKPALFDTDADFVTASRRLIADKKLAGEANPEDDEAEDIE